MDYTTNDKAFIKIYRKMLDWEWYSDVNTFRVFIHCLLKANWKAGRWHGLSYEAGEFITSFPSLAAETGLTVQQVRTAINHLKSTGEITDRITDGLTGKKLTRGRIIKVSKWDLYQTANRQNNSQSNSQINRRATGKQQASNRQATAEEEYKEYKEYKKPPYSPPVGDGGAGVQVDLTKDPYDMTDDEFKAALRQVLTEGEEEP